MGFSFELRNILLVEVCQGFHNTLLNNANCTISIGVVDQLAPCAGYDGGLNFVEEKKLPCRHLRPWSDIHFQPVDLVRIRPGWDGIGIGIAMALAMGLGGCVHTINKKRVGR